MSENKDSTEVALNKSVRGALRAILNQSGATQADMSRASGLSASYISDLLNGRRPINLRNLVKMCDAMGWKFKINLAPAGDPTP